MKATINIEIESKKLDDTVKYLTGSKCELYDEDFDPCMDCDKLERDINQSDAIDYIYETDNPDYILRRAFGVGSGELNDETIFCKDWTVIFVNGVAVATCESHNKADKIIAKIVSEVGCDASGGEG